MMYVLAFLAAIAGAAAGWAIAFVLAATLLGGSGVDCAMLAFWGFGLLGGIVGLVAGILIAWLLSRRFARSPVKLSRIALILVTLFVAVNIVAFVISSGARLFEFAGFGAGEPAIVFEVRLPAGQALPPDIKTARVMLRTPAGDTDAWIDDKRERADDGGRPTIGGVVKMVERTSDRMLRVTLPGAPTHIFKVKVPWWPLPTREHSPWQRADFVERPGDGEPAPAGDDAYEFRFYVN